MSIGLVGAMGGSSPPSVATQNPSQSASNSSATQGASIGSAGNAPTGGAIATDTSQAVKPTPASTPGVKVDFGTERLAKDGELQYPISGPDKFAKSMALLNQEVEPEVKEDAPEEAVVVDVAQDRDGSDVVVDVETRETVEKPQEQQDIATRDVVDQPKADAASPEDAVLEDAEAA